MLINNGKRVDGRKLDEMRKIEARVGVLKNANGSAFFGLGNTMCVAGVYGPREVHPRHKEKSEKAILRTEYRMAPFATTTRNRPGPSRRSKEISLVTREALTPVIFLEDLPKTAIDVHIEIIQADASTRCVGINAAAMALVDAGIPMRGLVCSCAAGKAEDTLLLDIAGKEDTEGQVDMPVAYYPHEKKVTLLQLDGITNKDEIKELLSMGIKGCEKVHKQQKLALKTKYEVDTND